MNQDLGRNCRDASHDENAKNGFALIEVLVGLAVLSIAMLAGLRAIANGADTQLAVSQRTMALWSADNALMNLRASRSWPDLGTTTFSCPQASYIFVCQRKVLSTLNCRQFRSTTKESFSIVNHCSKMG